MNLQIDQIVWPQFTTTTAVWLITIMVISFGFMAGMIIYTQFYRRQDRVWNDLLRYSYQHKLTSSEVKVLQRFFNSLNFSFQQNMNLLNAPDKLKDQLRAFLLTQPKESADKYVQIIDKMFPSNNSTLAINSIDDIEINESCSVHFADGIYLGFVFKKAGEELLIKVPGWNGANVQQNEGVILYFYRIEMGGFLFSGEIRKAKSGSFIFHHDGTIEMKGDEHLMAKVQKSATLRPMDMDLIPDMTLHMPAIDENGELEETVNTSDLTCVTDIISDQATLITIKEYIIPGFIKKYDIWELEIQFDPGKKIQLHGRLMESSEGKQSYLFKYVNISDEEKRSIFEEIKKYNPVRSKLS